MRIWRNKHFREQLDTSRSDTVLDNKGKDTQNV